MSKVLKFGIHKYFAVIYTLILLSCLCSSVSTSHAQKPVLCFDESCLDTNDFAVFANNKFIPTGIRTQALVALSRYPELKDVKIIFRFRKSRTPLTTFLQLGSALGTFKNRVFIISISDESNSRFAPILFSKLPFNAQIGVLGHELAHVSDFCRKTDLQLIWLSLRKINTKFVDKFELNTDYICIEHGLGYQLYAWSVYVRQALEIKEWKGVRANYSVQNNKQIDQRYMNPVTIEHLIAASSQYLE